MADEVQDPRAPGWKHDPTGRFLGRYWDGKGWTEHVVSQDRITSTDPIAVRPAQPARPAQRAQPAQPARPAQPTGVAPPMARPGAGVPVWVKVGLAAAVLGVLFFVMRADQDEDPPPTTANPPAAAAAPGRPSVHTLGETVRSGAFDITVHGFTDPQPPGEFLRPDAGRHFVSVDVEVANRASRAQQFSFLLAFHLVDAAGKHFDATFGDVKPPPPDGDLAPGQSLRGRVLFEVPDGMSGFAFRAQGSLTEPGAIFPLR